jgi:hypothetical protein
MLPEIVEETLNHLAQDNQVLQDYKIVGNERNCTTITLRYTSVDILEDKVKARLGPFVYHKSPARVSRNVNRRTIESTGTMGSSMNGFSDRNT